MNNFMHYDRTVLVTLERSKSVPLKHFQNINGSSFPVTLSDDPSCPIIEFIDSV